MGTAFTFQGRLEGAGGPVTDSCDFDLSLWDDLVAGSQVGTPTPHPAVSVVDGLINLLADFGEEAFNSQARWLQIQVRCPAGAGTYTPLDPRQELTPFFVLINGRDMGGPGINPNPGPRKLIVPDFAVGSTACEAWRVGQTRAPTQ